MTFELVSLVLLWISLLLSSLSLLFLSPRVGEEVGVVLALVEEEELLVAAGSPESCFVVCFQQLAIAGGVIDLNVVVYKDVEAGG